MKAIIVEGKIVAYCENPVYVKKHPDGGCFQPATAEDAIGVAAGDEVYNLFGFNEIEGAKYAIVKDDAEQRSSYFNTVANDVSETIEDVSTIEDALINQDIDLDDRIAAIEDCLIAMDTAE